MDTSTQFVLIAKRILRELRALNEAVGTALLGVQEQRRSISDQQKAYNQNHQTEQRSPQTLNAELQIPEYIQRDRRANDNRQYRVQVWLAIATSLAFIAAAIYAGYARSQRNAMLESNRINRDAFESVQRAFVTLADINFNVGYRIVPPHDKLWDFLGKRFRRVANVRDALK